MTSELFQTIQSKYTTTINPKEISSSINDILTKRIKDEIEGKCITDGYVKTDSVKIISRSMGKIVASHFNGSILYHIQFSAEICNPFEGMVLKAKVKNINKMGILATSGENDCLNILLAKQHHVDNDDFNKVESTDEIYVSVIGKRFEFGDNQISIIGKLIDKPIKAKKAKKVKPIDLKSTHSGAPAPSKKDASSPKEENNNPVEEIEFDEKLKKYKWLGKYNIGNKFTYKGRDYVTIEHAISAQKNPDSDFQDLFTKGSESYIGDIGSVAKKSANKTNMKKMKKKLIANWDKECLEFMRDILKVYYDANPELKKKLIETGDSVLLYRGKGVDTFWGLKQGIEEGENHFGNLLMALRSTL